MDSSHEGLVVTAPIYLLSADQECYLCGASNPVAALATVNLDDPEDPEFNEFASDDGFLLSYVEWLPEDLLAMILKLHPNYQVEYSMTAGEEYYSSVCHCGGHYGDHYVHQNILDLAFREPKSLKVERLPIEGSLVIPSGFSQSNFVKDLIEAQKPKF